MKRYQRIKVQKDIFKIFDIKTYKTVVDGKEIIILDKDIMSSIVNTHQYNWKQLHNLYMNTITFTNNTNNNTNNNNAIIEIVSSMPLT